MRAVITDPHGNQMEIDIEAPKVPDGKPDSAWGVNEVDGRLVIERIECPDEMQAAIKDSCEPLKVETLV
jgi:hypothetical protein